MLQMCEGYITQRICRSHSSFGVGVRIRVSVGVGVGAGVGIGSEPFQPELSTL